MFFFSDLQVIISTGRFVNASGCHSEAWQLSFVPALAGSQDSPLGYRCQSDVCAAAKVFLPPPITSEEEEERDNFLAKGELLRSK
jgi:hypothetical protein